MSKEDPQAQYHDYASRLDKAKQSVKVDESLRYAQSEIEEVLSELRSMDDGKLYSKLVMGYLVLCATIFVVHIIFFGYWVGLVGIIITPLFYGITKIVIDREIKKANNYRSKVQSSDLLTPAEIEGKKHSALTIIDLKTKRFQILLLMTAIFTPLVFMSIHQLVFGTLTLLNIGVAIVLGSFFWMIYFKKDIDILQLLKERLTRF